MRPVVCTTAYVLCAVHAGVSESGDEGVRVRASYMYRSFLYSGTVKIMWQNNGRGLVRFNLVT